LTVSVGLLLAVLVMSVRSPAATVAVPAVFNVTLKVFVPAVKAALAGNAAFASLELTAIVSVTVPTRFQFASTALTVTLNAVPAVRTVGVPVFPLAVPAAAASPGTSNCSFTNGPAATVTAGLVFAVLLLSVMSLAVRV